MKWKCDVCGYIWEGSAPPAECPNCHSSAEHYAPLAEESES